ncbi:hypothetical protein [Salinibacillus xinjiangensis]|uniref:Phosphotransferase n=1 Tax=Salinibacillus xinjiangensis TaxID=1229268 RepID=A0A6G1X2K9_9BACI|nr:hypothetical protein [Salinibacillus xinjiangensis]MRG85058.1 hypothetical protein [Salinibacillus xinjiangensis]
MKKLFIVYDNIEQPGPEIKNIVGDKSFGEIVYKRVSLKNRFLSSIESYDFVIGCFELNNQQQLEEVEEVLVNLPSHTVVLHLFSHAVISSTEQFDVLVKKSQYVNETVSVDDLSYVFSALDQYREFLQVAKHASTRQIPEQIPYTSLENQAFSDISNYSQFLLYISGGFDARFFNSLKGDEYSVVKTSVNIQKIKKEYHFYHLLPDSMKPWFVMPYNYEENEHSASYTMERFHMTDMAIRWIHGSVSLAEMNRFLSKVFYFVTNRHETSIPKGEYKAIADDLYLHKLDQRVEELKEHDKYSEIEPYIQAGTDYSSIDDIVSEYKSLYNEIASGVSVGKSVIGHGDLCFSNMLYNKELSLLRLIDPKGALEEKELWTNPYYDIAKLSHSICGKYDFFNSGMYDITLNENCHFALSIDFDNKEYIELFKKHLAKHGFDYQLVRLYESSLFLSMLPLHMDNPQKVFGFILNAIEILNEVKTCTKN